MTARKSTTAKTASTSQPAAPPSSSTTATTATTRRPAGQPDEVEGGVPTTAPCARPGCGHTRGIHVSNGTTCWGRIDCPCTGYARSKAALDDPSDDQPNEPIEGGPQIGLTMGGVAAPEPDAATDGRP